MFRAEFQTGLGLFFWLTVFWTVDVGPASAVAEVQYCAERQEATPLYPCFDSQELAEHSCALIRCRAREIYSSSPKK
jgi:hypothetical protein